MKCPHCGKRIPEAIVAEHIRERARKPESWEAKREPGVAPNISETFKRSARLELVGGLQKTTPTRVRD